MLDKPRDRAKEIVSRLHREFSNGPGNSFQYVGPGGMWKVNAVLELMRLAYEKGREEVGDAKP